MTLIYTFHVLIIATLLLSGIFIVTVRGTKRPIIYMSLYQFVLSFLIIVNLFQTSHTPIYGQALWNPLHLLMMLSVYPFLFAYIFGMVRPGSTGVRFWLTAYLPSAVLAALYFIFEALFGSLPLFSNYADLRNCLDLPQLWVLFAAAGFSAVMISCYTVRAIGMLRRYKRNLEADFSYTEGCTLGWMWWAIALTLFKWFILFSNVMVEGIVISFIGLFFHTLEPVIITVLALRQKDLLPKQERGIPQLQPCDYEPSAEKHILLRQKLIALLEKDEIFTNPELNSFKLSKIMKISRTHLSQIINQNMNTTFYNLINDYRLKKSVEMMRDPLHNDLNMSEIAEICGFKSLSSYSKYFRQIYGKSPMEWRKGR